LAQHRHHSDTNSLTLRLTPHGHLIADTGDGGPLVEAFVRGAGYGLLRLGAGTTRVLSPDLAWWRNFSRRAISALCHQASTNVSPPEAELAALVPTVPMMKGAEYVTADVLSRLWQEIVAAVAKEAGPDLPGFLSALNPAWNTIGRVHFNLAENRGDPDFPFAFMASYTTELAASGQARHVPLGQALHDYAEDHSRLLNLLLPVSRASQSCPWLKEMVEGREIYHPLRWKPANAARFWIAHRISVLLELFYACPQVGLPPPNTA